MEQKKESSFERMIHVYQELKKRGHFETDNQSVELAKHRETIKRYVRHIKPLAELDGNRVVYQKEEKKYSLIHNEEHIYHIWLLSILLYGSRSLSNEDVETLMDFISKPFSPDFLAPIRKLNSSYKLFYKPMTDVSILEWLREIYAGIRDRFILKMVYCNHSKIIEKHEIKPLSVSYDQGYFYVTADSLTDPGRGTWNFRLDRIQHLKRTKRKFNVNQHGTDFFQAGEHANLAFMMHGGEKKLRVKLKLEAWLVQYMTDQFPYHEHLGSEGGKEIYKVTVMNEDSVLFWVLKQRNWVEVLEPASLRLKMKETIQSMLRVYE